MCVERYAKSAAIVANESVERYAEKDAQWIVDLEKRQTYIMAQYDRDRDGNYYVTRQDVVVGVLTK